nr:MAG: hypothetical protein [Bacteriophage sp.]
MLRNKDRKLAEKTRTFSRVIADSAAETDTNAQALLTATYGFNGWVAGLTDEGIIDGIEALEHDLDQINDFAVEAQKAAAETIIKTYETRDTLRKLKTRRNNRAKEQNGKKTWEHLKEEDANERRK